MFATGKPTIIFLGDAPEEDYVLGAMGWASKKLPIIFVIEDNNFSILTEKNVEEIGKLAMSPNLSKWSLII